MDGGWWKWVRMALLPHIVGSVGSVKTFFTSYCSIRTKIKVMFLVQCYFSHGDHAQ